MHDSELKQFESEGYFAPTWREERLEGAKVVGAKVLQRLRQTGAAAALRSLWIAGYDEETWPAALAFLTEGGAPQLEKLGLEFVYHKGAAASAEVGRALAAALPRLEGLALVGRHLFAALAHPGVKRLALTGYDAIASLTQQATAPAFPSVLQLDLACYPGSLSHLLDKTPEGPGAAKALPTLLSRGHFPALRELDLSRCEPGEKEPLNLGGEVRVHALLPRLDVLPGLTRLRLPSLRQPDDVEVLRGLLTSLPETVIEIVRDYGSLTGGLEPSPRLVLPTAAFWPPSDQVHGREALHVWLRHDDPYGTYVDLSGLVRALDAHAATLDEVARSAWRHFWDVLAELTYGDDEGEDLPFPFDELVAGLEALGPEWREERHRWKELHQELSRHLRCCAGTEVLMRRYWGW